MKLHEILKEYAIQLATGVIGVNPGPEEFATRLKRSPFNAIRFLLDDDKLYIWGDDIWHIDMAIELGLKSKLFDDNLLTGYFTEDGYHITEPGNNENELFTHPKVIKMLDGRTLNELPDVP